MATLILFVTPVSVHAQDKGTIKAEAKTALERLRSEGEPKDRCSLGAYVGLGNYVTRVFADTTLKPGDRITRFQAADVSARSSDDLLVMVRGTAVGALVPVAVERGGQIQEVKVVCGNARPASEAMIAGLQLAASGKFEDCANYFQSNSTFGTFGAMMKVQCASVAKGWGGAALSGLVWDAMKMLIEDARYAPAMRDDAVERLQRSEAVITNGIGSAKFDALVDETHTWPGAEGAFERATPDWATFRRNAEAALIARLVDPDSARIEWPYGFLYGSWKPLLAKRVEGYWSCGLINARNRMGGYTGSTYFVVVLDRRGSVLLSDMGSASDRYDLVSSQCGNSVKLLPPAPAELRVAVPADPPSKATSIADELKKLADLRASGALTDGEFEAAKAKLLGRPVP